MILTIFLYISYVYNEIFTRPNGIFARLGRVDVDFFYLWRGQLISPEKFPATTDMRHRA